MCVCKSAAPIRCGGRSDSLRKFSDDFDEPRTKANQMRVIVALELTVEEIAHLHLMQDEDGEHPPTDELITSIVRSVIQDDVEELRRRAA